jgi:hypothetical protein
MAENQTLRSLLRGLATFIGEAAGGFPPTFFPRGIQLTDIDLAPLSKQRLWKSSYLFFALLSCEKPVLSL